MVIKSEDADYFAPVMASSMGGKATSIACERSVRENTRTDSRDAESQQNTDFVDSRSVLDDLDDLMLSMSSVENVRSMDDAMSRAEALDKRDECCAPASNLHAPENDAATLPKEDKLKKKKELLRRVLPILSKADGAKKQGSGSIVTALTSKESYATEDDQSKSVGRMDRSFRSSVSECPSRNKLFVKRPSRPQMSFQSDRDMRLNGDDGSVSVSIKAAMSDCEVETEKGDERKRNQGMKDVSLVDCVTEDSSVVTEKRSIFGRNRPKKDLIGQETIDARSVRQRERRDDDTTEGQHSMNNYRMKGVSLADCVTEASSVVTEERGIIGRKRSKQEMINQESSVSPLLPAASAIPPVSEQKQRRKHDDTFKVRSDSGDAHALKSETTIKSQDSVNKYRIKDVSLADCVTEASSVATEKRSMFGRNRTKKAKKRQSRVGASSVSDSSVSPLASEHGQRTRQDDTFEFKNEKYSNGTVGTGAQQSISGHEKKRASLADHLTENSSVATGKLSIFGRDRSQKQVTRQQDTSTQSVRNSSAGPLAKESLKQDEQESNVMKKPVEPKSVTSDNARSGVPEFLSSDNRLEHVSSDITFSSMPAFAHDMIRSSPSRVTRVPGLGFDKKTMPISPVSEALQFAKSQAGILKSKLDEEASCRDIRNKAAVESARKDETCPRTFHSVKDPLACGINDVMSIIDPEWEDCEEFGKGKRSYQQADSGYCVSDVVQSLRARFACDAFGDVMNTVESGWSDSRPRQHDSQQRMETQHDLPADSPGMTANETVTALRALRRQLSGGSVEMNVNGAYSERGDETRLEITKRAAQSSPTAFGEPTTAHVESQPSDESANVMNESISLSSNKDYERPIGSVVSNTSMNMNTRNNPIRTFKTKRGRKKNNNDDESQMVSSFFSGDTPIINNHAKEATQAIVSNSPQGSGKVKPGANNAKVYKRTWLASKEMRLSRDAAVASQGKKERENTTEEMAEKRAQVKRLIEETLLEGEEEEDLESEEANYDDEAEEEAEEEEKEEERSICTAAPKQYRGNKTPVFNGTKTLRDVQLVLSASSTLELPKHKRNTVIRFATVPGDISYQQQMTDTLHNEHVELERKKAHLQLAKRAVISGQYMDTLDPCFRVFDPALDACDKFCTTSPSEDSDDECSIASASICEDKPSIGLRQRAQNYMMEPSVWPCSGRSRRVKAPCRLV